VKRLGWGLLILICAPIVLVVLGLIGTELNKAYWDRQVRKLCEKEGGVTVYEVVTVSLEQYPTLRLTARGGLILPSDSQLNEGDPFYYKNSTKVLRKKNPTVRRYDSEVVRVEDEKVLGKKTSFSRIGGDFPTVIGHPSSYSCSDVKGFKNDLFNSVIDIKER